MSRKAGQEKKKRHEKYIYPAPHPEKSLFVWNVNKVNPTTTDAVKKNACKTTETS